VAHTSPPRSRRRTNSSTRWRTLNTTASARSRAGSKATVATSSGGGVRRATWRTSSPRAHRCSSAPWVPNRASTSAGASAANCATRRTPSRRSTVTRSSPGSVVPAGVGISRTSIGRSARKSTLPPGATTTQSWAGARRAASSATNTPSAMPQRTSHTPSSTSRSVMTAAASGSPP